MKYLFFLTLVSALCLSCVPAVNEQVTDNDTVIVHNITVDSVISDTIKIDTIK